MGIRSFFFFEIVNQFSPVGIVARQIRIQFAGGDNVLFFVRHARRQFGFLACQGAYCIIFTNVPYIGTINIH